MAGHRAIRLGVVVLALLVTVIALPRGADAATVTVRIGEGLSPREVRIEPGTTVTWVNESGNRHRVRSVEGPAEFDSGDLEPGGTFSFTFRSLGTTTYRDERNKDVAAFQGSVVVERATQATPTPSSGATPPPATGADVTMAGRVFSPSTVTIAAGGSVRWLNDDDRDHTVTADGGGFDSGTMATGARYSRTFTTPGTFSYICAIHPDMTGTVRVAGPGGATPPPPSPTPVPTPTPPPPSPVAGGVTIFDFRFGPADLTIAAGSTVTWTNAGRALHSATAEDGSFDSGLLSTGERFSRAFPTPGTYAYLCSIHPEMTATIRVAGASGTAPPPSARPSPTPVPTAPPGSIAVVDFAYRPASITVPVGTTLTWANVGRAPHTVTDAAGRFDSGVIGSGGRFSHRFAAPGTYRYLCSLHPGMVGTVLVPDATGAVPSAPPDVPSPSPAPVSPAGPSGATILDFAYEPATLTVPAGTTVRWVNAGAAPHTVTDRGGVFDSGMLDPGASWERRFDGPGTFAYWCVLHPQMVATLVVTAAEGGLSPEPGAGGATGGTGAPAGGGAAGGGSSGSGGSGGGLPGAGPGSAAWAAEDVGRVALTIAAIVTAVALFGAVVRGSVRPPA